MAVQACLILLLTFTAQQCFGKLEQITLDRLGYLRKDICKPQIALTINGIHSLMENEQACSAFGATLDSTLTLTENKEYMEVFEFFVESVKNVVTNPAVREVMKKRLIVSDALFKNSSVRNFVMNGIRTVYLLMTDREILRGIRQLYRANAILLTNARSQNRITSFVLNLAKTMTNRTTLEHIRQTVRAIDGILSSEAAKASIAKGMRTLQDRVGSLSPRVSGRVGKLHRRYMGQE